MNFGFCDLHIFSSRTGREPRGNRLTRMGKIAIKTEMLLVCVAKLYILCTVYVFCFIIVFLVAVLLV